MTRVWTTLVLSASLFFCLGAPGEAAAGDIVVINRCKSPLKFAVRFYDGSKWRNEGWWTIGQGKRSTLTDTSGKRVSTPRVRIYYYAETTEGRKVYFRGTHVFNVGNQLLPMKEFDDKYDDTELYFNDC